MNGYPQIETVLDNGIVPERSRPFYHAKPDAILPRETPRLRRCCMKNIHQQGPPSGNTRMQESLQHLSPSE
ncbi:MAG: hypothetical protein Q7J03_00555 [Methanoregula sp.]|nr:hypothetical protein [Methanoregula sp.]